MDFLRLDTHQLDTSGKLSDVHVYNKIQISPKVIEDYKYFIFHHLEVDISRKNTPLVTNIIHYRNVSAGVSEYVKRKVEYSKMRVYNDKFRSENERIESLKKSFLGELIKLIVPLARSGFYKKPEKYNDDEVTCIFCQGNLKGWKLNDKPMKEHMKKFPTCPFLLRLDVGNRPAGEHCDRVKSIDYDTTESNKMPGKYDVEYIVKPMIGDLKSTKEWLFIEEKNLYWREDTFKKYLYLKHLALDGLFVRQKRDFSYTICCGCHKEVPILEGCKNLSRSMFHTNNCSYLFDDPVEDMAMNEKLKDFCIVEYSVLEDEVEARLDSRRIVEISNSCKINRDLIKRYVDCRLRNKGKDYESSYELLCDIRNDTISNYFERPETNVLEFVLEDNNCVVCLDQPISIVFLPCGHLRTCKTCSEKLLTCPVCRKEIERKIRNIRLHGIN